MVRRRHSDLVTVVVVIVVVVVVIVVVVIVVVVVVIVVVVGSCGGCRGLEQRSWMRMRMREVRRRRVGREWSRCAAMERGCEMWEWSVRGASLPLLLLLLLLYSSNLLWYLSETDSALKG